MYKKNKNTKIVFVFNSNIIIELEIDINKKSSLIILLKETDQTGCYKFVLFSKALAMRD